MSHIPHGTRFHSLRIHVYYVAIYRAHAVYDNENATNVIRSGRRSVHASCSDCGLGCGLIMHAPHVHTIQMQLITTNRTLIHFRSSYEDTRSHFRRGSTRIAALLSAFFPSHLIWVNSCGCSVTLSRIFVCRDECPNQCLFPCSAASGWAVLLSNNWWILVFGERDTFLR